MKEASRTQSMFLWSLHNLQSSQNGIPLRLILALIGFTATAAQILLLRELLVVYYGNEISLGVILANWLLWVAFGSSVFGRILVQTERPQFVLAALQIAAAVVLPLTLPSARIVRELSGAVPGEILSPGTMFVSSFLLLSLFCSVSGAMFPVGSRLYSRLTRSSTAEGTSSVYLLEAIGSGIGGLLTSLVMIQTMQSLQVAIVLSLLNVTAAVVLIDRSALRRLSFWIFWIAAAVFLFVYAVPRLESISLRMLWGDLNVIETRNSAYGNLTVIENEESRTLYVNSLVAFTCPDLEAAEESVHFALLQHPKPQTLLLIGGGLNGSVRQALQHQCLKKIDYVELDPEIFDLARRFFADNYVPLTSDPRVKIHMTDGRLFLRFARTNYDVIIVNLPDPKTAQLNRFYTQEFFQETRQKLNPDGLLSFQVSGAENYISNELAAFLGCLHRTLKSVFNEILVFPGGRVHFFASELPGALTADAEILINRLHSRGIQTQYVREYYLPFRLMPDRLQDLEQQLIDHGGDRINSDFSPIAYYFDMLFWSTRFHRGYLWIMTGLNKLSFHTVLSVILAVSLTMAVVLLVRKGSTSFAGASASYCVWAMGFTVLSLEILLLLGFQAVYGYVYDRLSLIVATFMVGLASGSWWSLRREHVTDSKNGTPLDLTFLFWLQSAAAASALLLCGLLFLFAKIDIRLLVFLVSTLAFPALAFLAGMLGGFQFPLASRLYFPDKDGPVNPGLLYGLDVLGAWTASLFLSVVFFPVYGLFPSALLIAAFNLGPILLAGAAAVTARRVPADRT